MTISFRIDIIALMKKIKYIWYLFLLTAVLLLSACGKIQPLEYKINKSDNLKEYESELADESAFQERLEQEKRAREAESKAQEEAAVWVKKQPGKDKRRVKGIYLTTNTAASGSAVDRLLEGIDKTELNAMVIDILNDDGIISFEMHSPLIDEVGASRNRIRDIRAFMEKLKAHDVYAIARIVSFRNPFLAEIKPEWLNHNADGTVFVDRSGDTWINPYNRDAWEYIAEVAEQCADAGFDEIQFDYVRFCTEKGMNNVVYSAEETKGISKTKIITEFVRFLSDRLADKNVFISTDVFGTIIGSYVDTVSVGQDYPVMSGAVDYMCPMIYPSHYSSGNFGLSNPDSDPYAAILGACNASRKDLQLEYTEGVHQAIVRPWLQGFTASYLSSYIEYGPEEIRKEIQAVYDAGYDEWLIWNASSIYNWDCFLTEEEAAQEDMIMHKNRNQLQN